MTTLRVLNLEASITGGLLRDPLGGAQDVSIPGISTFQGIVKALIVPGLAACVLGILIGVVLWVMGSTASNPHRASSGKWTVVVAVAAAIVIGMSSTLIDWGHSTGENVGAGTVQVQPTR